MTKIGSGNTGRASRGSKLVRVGMAQDMALYDRLPRPVRDALKDLPSSYAAKGLLGLSRKIHPEILALNLRDHAHDEHVAFMREEFGVCP